MYNEMVEMYYKNYSQLNTTQKEELVLKMDNLTTKFRSNTTSDYFDLIK